MNYTNDASNSTITDEELIMDYYQNGTEASFNLLHKRHAADLTDFIYNRYIRNRASAEDVVQHTFMVIHSERTYKPGKSFAKWLYSIAGNWAIRQTVLKRRVKAGGGEPVFSLNQLADDDSEDSFNEDEKSESTDMPVGSGMLQIFHAEGRENIHYRPETVFEALKQLDDEQRDVLTRLFYDNQSERDVADHLGTTRHQVRRIAHAAQVILKDHLLSQTELV